MKDETLYTPAHVGLWTNLKLLKLARVVDRPRDHTWGAVQKILHTVLMQAPDGALDGYTPTDLEDLAQTSIAGIVQAMIDTGWMHQDGDRITMHEWFDYSGKGIAKKAQRTQQKRAERQAKRPVAGDVARCRSDVAATSHDVASKRRGEGESEEIEREIEIIERERIPDALSEAVDEIHQEGNQTPPVQASAPERAPTLGRSRVRVPGQTRGIVGLASEAGWPKTCEELLAQPLVASERARHPAFDGGEGRLSFDDVVANFFEHHQRRERAEGIAKPEWPGAAIRRLRTWLSHDYERSRKAYEAERERRARAAGGGGFVQAGTREAMLSSAVGDDVAKARDFATWRRYRDELEAQGERAMRQPEWVAAGRPRGEDVLADLRRKAAAE